VLIEAIILFGAIIGGIYALLALGFTLIYGVARVTNLAHGSFYMVGAYLFSVFGTISFFRSWLILALILSVILVGILGGVVYRLTIHPVIGDDVAIMVVTVSFGLIFQQLMLIFFGAKNQGLLPFAKGSVIVWGVTLTYTQIVTFAVSMILFASLMVFIAKTKIGKAMRAVSQDREVAMLMGINTDRLYMLTMGLAAMLSGTAGIFHVASSIGYAAPWIWLYPLSLAFCIVVVGGLGSIKGTLIGGFIIGYSEQIVALAVPQGGGLVPVVPFAILVVVLLLRPKGLFGKRVEMED
jgi:branched-chain amino acid transport system permease protein